MFRIEPKLTEQQQQTSATNEQSQFSLHHVSVVLLIHSKLHKLPMKSGWLDWLAILLACLLAVLVSKPGGFCGSDCDKLIKLLPQQQLAKLCSSRFSLSSSIAAPPLLSYIRRLAIPIAVHRNTRTSFFQASSISLRKIQNLLFL